VLCMLDISTIIFLAIGQVSYVKSGSFVPFSSPFIDSILVDTMTSCLF
jgi:hypothetical protein